MVPAGCVYVCVGCSIRVVANMKDKEDKVARNGAILNLTEEVLLNLWLFHRGVRDALCPCTMNFL